MFKEYERVMIIRSGMTGIIVDKAIVNGVAKYVVEADVFNGDAPHGVEWPLVHCTEKDLCKIIQA